MKPRQKTYREVMFNMADDIPNMAEIMIRALDEDTLKDLYEFFLRMYDLDEEEDDNDDYYIEEE